MQSKRIIFSGGGTGGGTYPAIAVAQALLAAHPNTQILWIGSVNGIERELVENAGIRFVAALSGPIVGKNILQRVSSLLKIGIGTLSALRHYVRFRPDALLMTGGWPVLPATLAAILMRVPFAVLLPDIEPGSTISRLARYADRILTTTSQSSQYFKNITVIETGYPIRPALLEAAGFSVSGEQIIDDDLVQQARSHFDLDASVPTVLIFGGSKGTRSLNKAVMDALTSLTAAANVIHISGAADWDYVQKRAVDRVVTDMSGEIDPNEAKRFGRDTIDLDAATTRRYHPYQYLHTQEMALALAAADVVVSRSGASVLGEFPLFELPAILVPYPFTWRYQKVNADFLVEQGAAIRLDDEQLDDQLSNNLVALLRDNTRRRHMAGAMGRMKRPEAAAQAAAELYSMAAKKAAR